MIKQSRLLSKFYKELSEWIAHGCTDEKEVFDTNCGLCDNLYSWVDDCEQGLQAELLSQLRAEFRCTNYPFNSGQPKLYADEDNKYTNQARLDWIAEHTPSED